MIILYKKIQYHKMKPFYINHKPNFKEIGFVKVYNNKKLHDRITDFLNNAHKK